MPQIATPYFGRLAYRPDAVIEFPAGLPGFESRRRFVPVELADYHPLIFLQSVEPEGPCFPTLPVSAVDPGYRLQAASPDLELVGLPPGNQPAPGEVLALAIVTVREDAITANLLAPVLVNLANRRAVQAIRPDGRHSHEHPLEAARGGEVAACS